MARAQKPTDADLTGDLSPDAALRRIVAACGVQLDKHRAVALKSGRPTGIHQTRVALRQLRAAITLFDGAVDDPDLAFLAAEAKWIAGELAPSRDLHVFLNEVATDAPALVRRVGRRLAAERLVRARQALTGRRYDDFARHLHGVATTIPSKAGAAKADAERAVVTGATGTPLSRFASTALTGRHDKVVKRGHGISRLGRTRLHRLRIAVKKLRYAAIFLRPLYAGPAASRGRAAAQATTAYIDATARLQGVLGSLNDRAVAADIAASILQAARPSEKLDKPLALLAKEIKRGARRDERRLARAWKAFGKVEPFWRA